MTPIYLIAVAAVVGALIGVAGLIVINIYLLKGEADELEALIRTADDAVANRET